MKIIRVWPQLSFALVFLSSCGGASQSGEPAGEILDPWPFKVKYVTLECLAGRVYATAPDGTRYGVNGSARGDSPGTEPIQSYYDIKAVMDHGLKLCEDNRRAVNLVPPTTKRTNNPQPGRTRVEKNEGPSDLIGGFSVISTDASPIDGKRPELSVTCDDERKPSLFINLVRAPPRAPPPRGVFATINIDGKTTRFEAAWFPEHSWVGREMAPRTELGLVRAIANAREVTMSGLDGFAALPITWRVDLPAKERDRFLRQCGPRA